MLEEDMDETRFAGSALNVSGVSCQNEGHFADYPRGISSAIGFRTK